MNGLQIVGNMIIDRKGETVAIFNLANRELCEAIVNYVNTSFGRDKQRLELVSALKRIATLDQCANRRVGDYSDIAKQALEKLGVEP